MVTCSGGRLREFPVAVGLGLWCLGKRRQSDGGILLLVSARSGCEYEERHSWCCLAVSSISSVTGGNWVIRTQVQVVCTGKGEPFSEGSGPRRNDTVILLLSGWSGVLERALPILALILVDLYAYPVSSCRDKGVQAVGGLGRVESAHFQIQCLRALSKEFERGEERF